MECYVCRDNTTHYCTYCCYRTCCKKCAEDIGIECHCYQIDFYLITFLIK